MGAEIGAVVATEEAIADAAAGTTGVVVTAALVAVAAAGVVDDSTVLRLSVRSLAADAIDLNMSLILPSLLAILLLSKLVFYPSITELARESASFCSADFSSFGAGVNSAFGKSTLLEIDLNRPDAPPLAPKIPVNGCALYAFIFFCC